MHSCSCFSLCSEHDFGWFKAQLPQLTTRNSPWYGYLHSVYNEPPPLPVDLQVLELFYTGRLPTTECHYGHSGHRTSVPMCRAHVCDEWLVPRRNASSKAALAASHGTLLVGRLSLLSGKLVPGDEFVAMQPPPQKRRRYHSGEWVEVVRAAEDGEGIFYGAWFYPVRGSGVFVNTGQTHSYLSTEALVRHLLPLARKQAIPMKSGDECAGEWTESCAGDYEWANVTRAFHADSLHIVQRHNENMGFLLTHKLTEFGAEELLLARPRVPTVPDALLAGHMTCAAGPHGLRTGWRAQLPCNCSRHRLIVNCH